ncbi:MAG: ACP S-malonyltransferase, partial [Acholeplasmataceae bacterium]
ILNQDILAMFKDSNSFKHTYETQIMMVVTQSMMLDVLKEKGVTYEGVMGFSLGEMTALYAAGVFDYASLIRLTSARALAMQKACDDVEGTMAAVVKVSPEEIETVCKKFSNEQVFMTPVNYNAPMQTVISGHQSLLPEISEALKALGGRVIPLRVAGAFHTSLMSTYTDLYDEVLSQTKFKSPEKELISNVTGEILDNHVHHMMLKQMISPVLFTTMIKHLDHANYDRAVEIGPGNVLTGLLSKQYSRIKLLTIKDATSLEEIYDFT